MISVQSKLLGLAVLAVVLLSAGGCVQGGQRAKDSNDLTQLGMLYHGYQDINKQGPPTIDELAKYTQASNAAAMPVVNAVKAGKYVLYLGVNVNKLPKGAPSTVLGYEAAVPTSGGFVLMADTSVQTMTAAQFAAAAKPPDAKLSQP